MLSFAPDETGEKTLPQGVTGSARPFRRAQRNIPSPRFGKRPSVQAGATEYPFSSVWIEKIRAHLAPLFRCACLPDRRDEYTLRKAVFVRLRRERRSARHRSPSLLHLQSGKNVSFSLPSKLKKRIKLLQRYLNGVFIDVAVSVIYFIVNSFVPAEL